MKYLLLIATVLSLTSFSSPLARELEVSFEFKRKAERVFIHFTLIPKDGAAASVKYKMLGPDNEVIFDEDMNGSSRLEATYNLGTTYSKKGEYTFILKPKDRNAVAVKFPAKKRRYKFTDNIQLN